MSVPEIPVEEDGPGIDPSLRCHYGSESLEVLQAGGSILGMVALVPFLVAFAYVTASLHPESWTWKALLALAAIAVAGIPFIRTRERRVSIRKGEVAWTLHAFGRRLWTRKFAEPELDGLRVVVDGYVKSGAMGPSRPAGYAVVLGSRFGRPRVGGFRWEKDAEAFGKLMIAEFRYGPASREAVRGEPEVRAFLARSKLLPEESPPATPPAATAGRTPPPSPAAASRRAR